MNNWYRKLLADNIDYITNQVKSYHFTPPLNYDCCINFVLIKMEKRMARFDSTKSSIRTFINRTTKYLVLDYYRHNKTKPILVDPKQLDDIVPDTYHTSSHINYEVSTDTDFNYKSPETDYWEEQRNIAIAYCINELSSKDRNIVLLYYFDNITEQRIANMFGVTHQAISQQLHKALASIKPKIAERLKELEDIRSEL